ncbi:MAG: hypothetical protein JXR34_13415 [Bacteroidales bacterium]|nr:hypothetical protein [Bacteroidales bacterium]
MISKLVSIFLTTLLSISQLSGQYYGFDLNNKLYQLNNNEGVYPFKLKFPRYEYFTSSNKSPDSSNIHILRNQSMYIPDRVAIYQNELIGDGYYTFKEKKAKLIGEFVSNKDYSCLFDYTVDSIAHTLLGKAQNPKEFGYHYIVDKNLEPIQFPVKGIDNPDIFSFHINWKQPIEWENPEVKKILEDGNYGIFTPEFERLNRKKTIFTGKINFEYKVAPPDQSEFENEVIIENGWDYLKKNYWNDILYGQKRINNTYPNTLFWLYFDDSLDFNLKIALAQYYYSHPYFADYPVLGLTYHQIQAYFAYRSKQHRQLIQNNNKKESLMVNYRLPEADELTAEFAKSFEIQIDTTILFDQFRITELEYFEFLYWVADSIVRKELGEYGIANSEKAKTYKTYYQCDKYLNVIEFGDLSLYYKINWETKLDLSRNDIRDILKQSDSKLIEPSSNQLNANSLKFKFDEFDFLKYFHSTDKSMIYIDANYFHKRQVIQIYPEGKLGEFFKKCYGATPPTTDEIEKMKASLVTSITYEQAYSYYYWKNARQRANAKANPLNYYIIPTIEQWNQIVKGQPVEITTNLRLSDLIDNAAPKIETIPFRPIIDIFDFVPNPKL